MYPSVCRCCGEQIMARAANPNICMDCERLMEDESPQAAAHEAQKRPKHREVAANGDAVPAADADSEIISQAN